MANKILEVHAGEDKVEITAGSAITAGVPQLLGGGLVGVPSRSLAAGDIDELSITGRFRAVSVASQAWAVGDVIGYDADGDPLNGTAGTGACTKTETDWNFAIGTVVKAKTATESQGEVLLNVFGEGGQAAAVAGLGNNIADPGDAGAIPVGMSGHVNIVTAGAETRTIAAPTAVGQQLLLSLQTDAGDCVITVATTVNQTGNNTITLNDAGDAILLVAKKNGSNVRWSVVSNDGAALSTV